MKAVKRPLWIVPGVFSALVCLIEARRDTAAGHPWFAFFDGFFLAVGVFGCLLWAFAPPSDDDEARP
jgi:hypothetical protein